MDKPNKYNNKNTPAKIDPSYFGKSAPQAKELEEAVLGALLVDKNVITVLVDILQEESFYDERHKVVYRAMLRLFEKGNPIDLLTVSQELRQMGSLETIGGAFYLTELANRVASAANVEYHSRIVLQKFLQRELIQLGTEVINDAFDETGDVFELLERTEQTLFKIAERNVSRGVVSLGVLLESVKEQIKNAANQKTGLSGVPTGFTALDRLTNGWQKSDLIIVAARPAMGKCLGKGTKVMLYNGELKNVEAVQVGDLLMGDDSTPRKVLSIARGREQMYWVRQIHGIDYRVNESHILSLKRSRNEGKHKNGDVLNIEIKDYLPKSQKWKSNYKGYKVGVEFEEKPCTVEPYFLGLWLGDNFSPNDLAANLGLSGNEHIPQHYLTNSRKHRLALLAGLIDSAGHYNTNYGGTYEITTKFEPRAQQIKYLCDTLGFRTSLKSKKAQIKSIGYETTVWRVRFNGNVDEIPVRIPRKKAMVWTNPKNWQVTGVRVEKDIIDDYYGFEIDGNHLFLLEDATVTHNTAFTLALGTFASIDCEMPVAFFSLEMSSVQLATRIVSMRANIPSEVLRTGRLSPDELLRLDAAHQAMHKMPLFIDDTAGISILELRAKCRRLKLQHDIKLVIIDYLQLMKGDSESSKSGNREQEIASISRGLKALAKELSIPVIALAQLSRAVETRGGNKRPMLSDLRECVTGDTRVLLKNGSLMRIADLVGSQPEVWALDNNSYRLSARASDLVWKVGEKPIFKIRLASGRLIRATAEHRLLGANGWQTVEKLKQGDRLAILRKSPEPENPVFVAPERLIVLAQQLVFEEITKIPSFVFQLNSTQLRLFLNHLQLLETHIDDEENTIIDTKTKLYFQTKNFSLAEEIAILWTRFGVVIKIQTNFFNNFELLKLSDSFAENDIFWDKVLSIEADGVEDVYDLTVLEHHNWVANGIISHNSGAIEQDADIVSFLYRPEYYGLTEDDDGQPVQGIAEVIVAKHRNGAVETVRLRWDAQFAKFSNLADSEFGDIDPTEYFQVSNTNPLVAPPTNMDFPTLEDEGLKFKSQPNNDIPF